MPLALVALASCPTAAEAREEAVRIDIAGGDLSVAIAGLAQQAEVSIGSDSRLPAVKVAPLRGRMTVDAALSRLLGGTGLVARRVDVRAWRIEPAPRRMPVPAPATPPSPPPPAPPVPIVVTASKQTVALASLPMAVSVVSFSRNDADPSSDTADVAARVEGLAVTGSGPGRNRIFLRGIADSAFGGASQSTVAVVLDEARITYSAPDPDLRLVDVDRVEVLKGPTGSLYGSGTLGGVYHIVTRRPRLDTFELTATAGTTLSGRDDIGPSLSVVANVPVLADRAALRLAAYAMREPGWVDTGDRPESNDTRVSGVRAMAGAELGGWRLDLTGFAQWLNARDSSYVYAEGARARPAQLPEPHDNDLRHLAVRLSREFGRLHIVASSGATWHEVGDTIDASVGADGFGLPDPQTLDDERRYRVIDSEVRLWGERGAMRWLAGLSHVAATQNLVSVLNGSEDSLTLHSVARDSTDLAAFASLSLPLGKGVALDASARLSRDEVSERRGAEGGPVEIEATQVRFTPGFGLSWQKDAENLIWIRYGAAHRQGGIEGGVGGMTARTRGDAVRMVDAGWRMQSGHGAHLELGAWYGFWRDVQSDLLRPDGLTATANVGDAVTSGIDLTFAMRLSPHWHVGGGGDFTMARLIHDESGIDLDDRRLPVVPEFTLRGSVERDLSIGLADVLLTAGLRYVGPSRLSFDHAVDRPMGNYLDGSVSARATWDGWLTALSLQNLFGSEEDTFAFGNSLRFATMRQYTPLATRRLSMQVAYRF